MKKKKPVFTGKMRIKKNDEVLVLAGKDKGKRGRVVETDPDNGKVRVDGVNIATKHQKPKSTSTRNVAKQQLGEMQVPAAMPISKVMLVCPKCNKETRLASDKTPDGKPVRKCRKCDQFIDG